MPRVTVPQLQEAMQTLPRTFILHSVYAVNCTLAGKCMEQLNLGRVLFRFYVENPEDCVSHTPSSNSFRVP